MAKWTPVRRPAVQPSPAPAEPTTELVPTSGMEAVQMSRFRFELRSWAEIQAYAMVVVKSQFCPRGDTANEVAIKIAYGMEVGLSPNQAVQNISVINGRPAIWGDALPGLLYSSGKISYIKESAYIDPKYGYTAVCEIKRKDSPHPVIQKFSWANAKDAGLAEKDTYKKYPARMLQNRARSFACRDAAPDVLKGMISIEEAMDWPQKMSNERVAEVERVFESRPDNTSKPSMLITEGAPQEVQEGPQEAPEVPEAPEVQPPPKVAAKPIPKRPQEAPKPPPKGKYPDVSDDGLKDAIRTYIRELGQDVDEDALESLDRDSLENILEEVTEQYIEMCAKKKTAQKAEQAEIPLE